MSEDHSNVVPFPGKREAVISPKDVTRAAGLILAICDGDLKRAVAYARGLHERAANRAFAAAVTAELLKRLHQAAKAEKS